MNAHHSCLTPREESLRLSRTGLLIASPYNSIENKKEIQPGPYVSYTSALRCILRQNSYSVKSMHVLYMYSYLLPQEAL